VSVYSKHKSEAPVILMWGGGDLLVPACMEVSGKCVYTVLYGYGLLVTQHLL
jgi:hypothetical protein